MTGLGRLLVAIDEVGVMDPDPFLDMFLPEAGCRGSSSGASRPQKKVGEPWSGSGGSRGILGVLVQLPHCVVPTSRECFMGFALGPAKGIGDGNQALEYLLTLVLAIQLLGVHHL